MNEKDGIMSIPPIGSSRALGSGAPNPDTDPAFTQIVDAAWQAIQQFQANSDAINTQVAMQEVNKLNAYFQANGVPSPSSSPMAFAVYQAIQSGGSLSLGNACAEYGTANGASAVQAFENGTLSFSGLCSALNPFGSVYNDSQDAEAKTAMKNLQGALQLYNWYMQQGNKDPELLDPLLMEISTDIRTLNAALAPGNVSDGYLTIIKTFLNTPITPGGSDTLEALSAALSKDSSQANYTALQAALTAIGESSRNDGGDLQRILQFSISKEYGNS